MVYTTGQHIRKQTNTGTPSVGSHRMASRMTAITGTDFSVAITPAHSCRTAKSRYAAAASKLPANKDSAIPDTTRPMVQAAFT